MSFLSTAHPRLFTPQITCAAIGAFLALVPHLALWWRSGEWSYLASGDDVIYVAVARPAYHGEGKLRDPFCAIQERVPTAFSWFQFVPFTMPARWLGLSPWDVGILWRLVGGALTGLAAYRLATALLPIGFSTVGWSLTVTILWLADAGVITGRPLIDTVRLVRHALAETTPNSMGDGLGLYRVVNPLLNFPWLLLAITSFVSPARSTRAALIAGCWIGISILTYFFFWTALLGTIGLYAIWHAGRWLWYRSDESAIELRFSLLAMMIGLAIGGGQIIGNAITFANPELREGLDRASLGFHMEPGNPVRFRNWRSVWVMIGVALGVTVTARTRDRRIGLLTIFVATSYLLRNSAVVTGLEFFNTHWTYVQNAALWWLFLILALRAIRTVSRVGSTLVLIFSVIALGFAVTWRWYEATVAAEPRYYTELLRELRPLSAELAGLSPETTLAGPTSTNVAILYGRCGQLYQSPHTAHRSLIPDREVHQRHALNGWLLGLTETEYAKSASDPHFSMTSSARVRWQPDEVARARLEYFRRFARSDARGVIEQFAPLALLLPTEAPPPNRGGVWRRVAATPIWAIWTLEPR